MDPNQTSGIAAPSAGAVNRSVRPSEDRSNDNYWKHGHRGYCWGSAFVGATARLDRDVPAEVREQLAIELLATGQVDCECHLPPPGNRPLVMPRYDPTSPDR